MEQVGRGPYRVFYLGDDTEVADWVEAGFERVDGSVERRLSGDVRSS